MSCLLAQDGYNEPKLLGWKTTLQIQSSSVWLQVLGNAGTTMPAFKEMMVKWWIIKLICVRWQKIILMSYS